MANVSGLFDKARHIVGATVDPTAKTITFASPVFQNIYEEAADSIGYTHEYHTLKNRFESLGGSIDPTTDKPTAGLSALVSSIGNRLLEIRNAGTASVAEYVTLFEGYRIAGATIEEAKRDAREGAKAKFHSAMRRINRTSPADVLEAGARSTVKSELSKI